MIGQCKDCPRTRAQLGFFGVFVLVIQYPACQLSFTFYFEIGSHKTCQAGLELTHPVTQTSLELVIFPPRPPEQLKLEAISTGRVCTEWGGFTVFQEAPPDPAQGASAAVPACYTKSPSWQGDPLLHGGVCAHHTLLTGPCLASWAMPRTSSSWFS